MNVMPQRVQMFAFCFATLALSLIAALVFLDQKGIVNEMLHFTLLQRLPLAVT